MTFLSTWTADDKERLRNLVLHHRGIGGSVKDACQQFQFETNGRHTAKSARLRWLWQLRFTTGGTRQQDKKAQVPRETNATAVTEGILAERHTQAMREESLMDKGRSFGEDESSVRLLNAVSQILDDRRHLRDDVQEHKKLIELSQRKVKELEESRAELEQTIEQKNGELEKRDRQLIDTEYKLEQVQEDYNQLLETRAREYDRLSGQLAELQAKYDDLGAQYTSLRRETSAHAERLETNLQNAQARNAKLAQEAEAVRKENVALTRRITEFAQQIAGALGQIPNSEPPIVPVPIRASVSKTRAKDKDKDELKDKDDRAQA